jgi:hypothetical protein
MRLRNALDFTLVYIIYLVGIVVFIFYKNIYKTSLYTVNE